MTRSAPTQSPPSGNGILRAPDTARVAAMLQWACMLELAALKPGNVHRHAEGHVLAIGQFEASARAIATPMLAAGPGVGARVLAGVAATRAVVDTNTNLGIILLVAPMLEALVGAPAVDRSPAAGTDMPAVACTVGVGSTALAGAGGGMRADTGAVSGSGVARQCAARVHAVRLRSVLRSTGVADARAVYAAIRLAQPGGLGQRDDDADIAADPVITLREAMQRAADHDAIARAYVDHLRLVRRETAPLWQQLEREGFAQTACAARVYLHLLMRQPDTLVRRRFGTAVAQALQQEAIGRVAALRSLPAAEGWQQLLQWDQDLKRRRLNPGTSADFTVATAFWVALCRPESDRFDYSLDGLSRDEFPNVRMF